MMNKNEPLKPNPTKPPVIDLPPDPKEEVE